jgi:small subunit ribosomal protein S5
MSEQKRQPRAEREAESEFIEKLVAVNRVAKVVKGGRRFGFAALVVVGDGRGRVGTGHSKAKEVPDAIKKATEQAKRNMIRVPLRDGRTIHHDVLGIYGAGQVKLRSAPVGTGVIAGGPLRAIFDCLGVTDVVAKTIGSNNPYNMVNATLAALEKMQSPRQVAARRGKKVSDIVSQREGTQAGEASVEVADEE